MLIGRYGALLLVFSSIGCVAFQDCEYREFQKCRAHKAWWFSPDERCSSNPLSHYSRGWRNGYFDVLMGGDGTSPPVPPQCYWSPKYQTERGETAIECWYSGYRDGSAAALASCRDSYHPVPVSDEFRQCCPGCLPTDHAPYPIGRTTLGVFDRPVPDSPPIETPELPAPDGEANSRKSNRVKLINHDDSSSEPELPPSPSQASKELKTPSDDRKLRWQMKWAKPAAVTSSISNTLAQAFQQE